MGAERNEDFSPESSSEPSPAPSVMNTPLVHLRGRLHSLTFGVEEGREEGVGGGGGVEGGEGGDLRQEHDRHHHLGERNRNGQAMSVQWWLGLFKRRLGRQSRYPLTQQTCFSNSSPHNSFSTSQQKQTDMRPVLDSVRTNFCSHYKPNRENAIDETMVKFDGRSCLKQYVPMKPVRRGFKVWVKADSLNGYMCDFAVYTGKEGVVEKDLGGKVVKKLVEPLAGDHYHIYFDNYFLSVKLFEDLLDDGLYACGTFRRDRQGIPEDIKCTKLGNYWE